MKWKSNEELRPSWSQHSQNRLKLLQESWKSELTRHHYYPTDKAVVKISNLWILSPKFFKKYWKRNERNKNKLETNLDCKYMLNQLIWPKVKWFTWSIHIKIEEEVKIISPLNLKLTITHFFSVLIINELYLQICRGSTLIFIWI